MNVIDSCLWLEYFEQKEKIFPFEKIIRDKDRLLMPTIIVYEVHKKLLMQASEDAIKVALALLQRGEIITLDFNHAQDAARVSMQYKLPMADSIIYATARHHKATLWTQDKHFRGLPSVKFIEP